MRKILKVKAVIFDMDGVITNTMPDHFRAWKHILGGCGIHVSHLDVYKREGQRGISSVFEIFKEHNQKCDKKTAEWILRKKERFFKKNARRRFIPGSRRLLKGLHRRGFKLALVTGTSRHELHRILPDYLYNLFDVIVTGTDVRRGKPHPEPYRKALKELTVRPGEAVVIENAPFGIQSAQKAKIRCFAVQTSLPAGHIKQADRCFVSIKDLRRKVKFALWE